MKSEILLEINRVKEIMGLSPSLLNEQLAFLKSIAKSGKAELKAELKNYLDTYAKAMNVSTETALEAFEKDYAEALLKNDDNVVNKVFDDYFSIVSKDYADDLIEMYARVSPIEFGKEVVGAQLGAQYKGPYAKYMKPETKITDATFNSVRNMLYDVKSKKLNIVGDSSADILARESLAEFEEALEKKFTDYNDEYIKREEKREAEEILKQQEKELVTRSLDDWYDDVYVVDTKGKKQLTREEFRAQVKSAQAKVAGAKPLDIVTELINSAPDKKNAFQWINGQFKKQGGVGDVLEMTADGGIKTTNKLVQFTKSIGALGWGGLIVIGIAAAVFAPSVYESIYQKYKEIGSKYTDVYDALGERLSGNFYDLPDDVRFFIGREFTIEQAKKNDTTPYIKNIEYKENTDSEVGSITIKMSDDSIVKYETSDGKTFNKVGGTSKAETSSTFKVAELTKFLTGPDYGFKAEILLPSKEGDFVDYAEDQALSSGTYKFQDSTPESEGGPLTGQVKYENGVFKYIPE
jgi:hypothetical protein